MTRAAADFVPFARDAASRVEAIHAGFAAHGYDLHRHDDWLIGVTAFGVQDFHCRGARQRSTAGRIILMEPQEMHDGEAGIAEGFAYRIPWRSGGGRDVRYQGRDPGAG